ncbi:hypothetical protein DFH07DRAFT_857284 [Mycena maculata]|uniref:Uncharacterized protein n=1 Tax=Mycena maculata TaxID=230809 RepID=A0AAD7MLF3_9AGAR|nr:hypothetical protein DFH07DRAFT_857284 [Mycena maculata]
MRFRAPLLFFSLAMYTGYFKCMYALCTCSMPCPRTPPLYPPLRLARISLSPSMGSLPPSLRAQRRPRRWFTPPRFYQRRSFIISLVGFNHDLPFTPQGVDGASLQVFESSFFSHAFLVHCLVFTSFIGRGSFHNSLGPCL